jgi:hypothetical protein
MVLETPGLDIGRLKKHANIALGIIIGYSTVDMLVKYLNLDFYKMLKHKYLSNYFFGDREPWLDWQENIGIMLEQHSQSVFYVFLFLQTRSILLKVGACLLLFFAMVKTWWLGIISVNFYLLIGIIKRNMFKLSGVLTIQIVGLLFVGISIGLLSFFYTVKWAAVLDVTEYWKEAGIESLIYGFLPHGFDREVPVTWVGSILSDFILMVFYVKIGFVGLIVYIYMTIRYVRGVYLIILFFSFLHTPHLLYPISALLFAIYSKDYKNTRVFAK